MKHAHRPALLLNDIEDIACAASHELRDPLRQALIYCLELRKWTAPEAEKLIFALEEEISTVLERVAIIRAYSHLVRNPADKQPVDIDEIARQAAAECEALMTEKNGAIHIRQLPHALADAIQLKRLFVELMDNALRHNTHPNPTVTITSQKKGRCWSVRVEDNGPGIDADYRRLVMGLFRTVGNTALPEGHGAGLAFCARIAKHHGGQLTVNSSRHGGTVMQFTLEEADHD